MRHHHPRLVFLLLVVGVWVVGGCAAEKLIERGDSMLSMGNAIEAEAAYLSAQEKKPKLAQDVKFVAKLRQARSRAAYQRGVQLSGHGEWETAIGEFEKSIAIGPEAVDAPRALAEARREAAKVRHRRALDLADEGKLNEAIAELKRALELDPENLDIKDALDSVENTKQGRLQQSQTIYAQALALQSERRWQQADERLGEAIRANANHLRSRVSRHEGKVQLADARRHRASAQQAMADRRLDTAIGYYEESLAVWPFFDESVSELADVRQQRAIAQEYYDRAVKLAADKQWDEAVKAALASTQVFPHWREATALLATTRHEAALAHVRVGNAMLAEAKLTEAEASFNRALGYEATMLAAREGLAVADRIRGDEAVKKSLWGHALLWYTNANEHVGRPEFQAGIGAARARVAERIGFRLAVGTSGADGATVPSSSDLLGKVTRELKNEKPAYLDLVVAKPDVATDYTATVDLSRVDVAQKLTGSEARTHHYKISQQMPNPEIPRLQDELARLRGELHRLRADRNKPCWKCHGSGRRVHGQCHGTGRLAGNICPDCHGTGFRSCRVCGGDGRNSSVSDFDLQRKRREIDDVRDKLQREPALVAILVAAEWPYMVETYEKRGTMVAALRMTDSAGKIVHSDSVRSESTSSDSTIQGASPSIGLHADPLQLPTDHSVRESLLTATAKESSSQLITAAVQERINAAQTRAKAFSDAKDETRAVESYVDAALLAEPLDAKEATRVLTKLRGAMK